MLFGMYIKKHDFLIDLFLQNELFICCQLQHKTVKKNWNGENQGSTIEWQIPSSPCYLVGWGNSMEA